MLVLGVIEILLCIVGFVLFAPEISSLIYIMVDMSNKPIEHFNNYAKLHNNTVDEFLQYIYPYIHDMKTSDKISVVLAIIIIYFILLVVIRYNDIHFLFILSNIFAVYMLYTFILAFKLNTFLTLFLLVIGSAIILGARLMAFEIIESVIDMIIDILWNTIKMVLVAFKELFCDCINFFTGRKKEEKINGGVNYSYNTENSDYVEDEYYDEVKFNSEEFEYFKEKLDDYFSEKNNHIRTPYEILGVSEDDDLETIKKVYKSLSKTYHPDVNKSKNSNDMFIAITEAWEKIKKERMRNE